MADPIRLVLIEDDADYRELVRINLEDACDGRWRVELRVAETLKEGLAAAASGTDLLLLDLTLPDSRGLETLKRARAAVPEVPIVVLTNWGSEETGLEAVTLGAQDFLTKDRLEPRLLMRAIAFGFVRARHAALDRVLESLKEQIKQRQHAERAKDETMGVIAHEIRSPLSVITAAVTCVLDGMAGRLAEDQRRLLEMAAGSAARISRFADQMLDMSRLQSGEARLAPQPVNVTQLVDQTLDAIRLREPQRRAMLKTDIPHGLPLGYADPDSVVQLLTNLVENALRFARSKVVVSVRQGPALGDRPGVQVCVSDDGPGIAPERLPELFQRFRQLEPDGRARKGAGLGLAICRELAQANGGRVWAESAPDRGSRFSFALPTFVSVSGRARPGAAPATGA